MPPLAARKPAPRRHDDLDDYAVSGPVLDDEDDDDNPFDLSPPSKKARKRPEADAGLGIDEQVSVQKRARAPRAKLDEARLLGPAGVPKLRRRARNLRLEGKGHEFSDAARLLSLYQLWLDDLFPKARFLDALALVEKVGHKKVVVAARNGWIDEARRKPAADGAARPGSRPRTPAPPPDPDVPDDLDLYDDMPRAPPRGKDALDDADGLDALIGEAERADGGSRPRSRPQPSNAEPGQDDLDALIAEAEDADRDHDKHPIANSEGNDFADEAILAEIEGL